MICVRDFWYVQRGREDLKRNVLLKHIFLDNGYTTLYGLITANLSDDSAETLLTDLSMNVLEAFEFNGLNLHFNSENSQKDSVAFLKFPTTLIVI